MRATKLAIAAALAADAAVSNLIPAAQVFPVERATIPALPSIEIIGISSERIGDGPMVHHSMSVEITVSAITEDAADALLDSIVTATRARLLAAEYSTVPISLADGGNVLVELEATRWSISAADASSVVRGASVGVTAQVSE